MADSIVLHNNVQHNVSDAKHQKHYAVGQTQKNALHSFEFGVPERSAKAIYLAEYRKKNHDVWFRHHICSICGGKYNNNVKSRHFNSLKHKYAVLKLQMEELEKNK